MAKRPVPKYDFKAFGAAIKAARTGRKESRKKVCDEMFISPRYLANIENNGQHPSLQIFFELMLRYNISVDQFLSDKPAEKNTQRRQLDALLDGISDTGLAHYGISSVPFHSENCHSLSAPLLWICYAVERGFEGERYLSFASLFSHSGSRINQGFFYLYCVT